MQDAYTGDVGDYIKLSLLRELARGDYRLGVGWYKMPDEPSKNDGRHVAYLGVDRSGRPFDTERMSQIWRDIDPKLYDELRNIVIGQSRRVEHLERLLPTDTVVHDHPVPRQHRSLWFENMRTAFGHCDLVFVDPDNGLAPRGFRQGSAKSGKSITLEEIWKLRASVRHLIVYHHHTRFKGGHYKEIEAIGAALRGCEVGCIAAIRAKSHSPRVFFLLGFNQELWQRAKAFADKWGDRLEFIPIDGPPDSLNLPPSSPYGDRAMQTEMHMAQQIRDGRFDHLIFPNGRSS